MEADPNTTYHPGNDSEQTHEISDPRDPVGLIVFMGRLALGFGSIAGLIGWCYYVLVFLSWIGRPKTLFEVFILGFPLVYLTISLLASLGIFRRRTLFLLAIFLNLPVVMPLVYWIARGYAFELPTVICLFFVMSWTILFVGSLMGRFQKRLRNRSDRQAT